MKAIALSPSFTGPFQWLSMTLLGCQAARHLWARPLVSRGEHRGAPPDWATSKLSTPDRGHFSPGQELDPPMVKLVDGEAAGDDK